MSDGGPYRSEIGRFGRGLPFGTASGPGVVAERERERGREDSLAWVTRGGYPSSLPRSNEVIDVHPPLSSCIVKMEEAFTFAIQVRVHALGMT